VGLTFFYIYNSRLFEQDAYVKLALLLYLAKQSQVSFGEDQFLVHGFIKHREIDLSNF